MPLYIILFQLIVLILSATIHEYSHGWAAFELGDYTAKDAGRLTINPLKHLDPFGSFILPLLTFFAFGFALGSAKPVPYNPYNLRDQKYGGAKVAIAGPLSNLIMAVFFGLILRFFFLKPELISNSIIPLLLSLVVYINLLLFIFNLVPIPPLDGSKVILPFLPYNWQVNIMKLENYGLIFVLFFVMIGFEIIMPLINLMYKVIVGANFI